MSKETEAYIVTEAEAYIVTEATPIIAESPSKGGRWKSGLCSCFQHGICHPDLWTACCFPAVIYAQLLNRMKMTWLGEPTSASEEYKKTFCIVLGISIANFFVQLFIGCSSDPLVEIDEVQNDECDPWNVGGICNFLFVVYVLVIMTRLRMAIREKYSIREENCKGCEDFCCVFFCGCLSAVQMADQTADYEQVPAVCCSVTGLPPPLAEGRTIDV